MTNLYLDVCMQLEIKKHKYYINNLLFKKTSILHFF